MSSPYIGEIRMFGGNFAPANWMFCNGQLLPISQYETLFNLIGTTYGGDGQSTFALPDLRGRFPLHQGSEFPLGQIAGSVQGPAGSYWSTDPAGNTAAYSDQAANSEMASTAIASTGGNQPHDNRQPYLAVSFIIALFGIYPSQS
jgi:microcystin-dependent protein